MIDYARLRDITGEVEQELIYALQRFPRQSASSHEAFAILQEEVDEAWDEIKRNNKERAREEMIQVAAMAMRFLLEID